MNAKTFCRLFIFSVLFILWGAPAFPQSLFYEGKTITIVQGREAGDAGDMRVKAMLPFIQKHIPGTPTIISEYMPGGGGRKAANHVYRNVKPDGLTLGNLGAGFISNAVLGETCVQYDIDKFTYLGSPYSAAHYVFLTRRDLQAGNLEKLRATPGIRIGAQSVGHTIFETPKGDKHPQFSSLPELETFARSERERKVLAMQRGFRLAGSPFFLPPGVPKERLEILQGAMRKALKDPEFVKEFKKLTGDEPTPLTHEANEKAVRDIPREPEIIDLFKKIVGAGPLPAR